MKSFLPLLFLGSVLATELKSQTKMYDLEFDPEVYTTQSFTLDKKQYRVRAYENIIYVATPVDTAYQKLNIYVPEPYFEGETINGYTKETAPIFFPNGVEGYLPGAPLTLNGGGRPPMPNRPDGAPRMMPGVPKDADMQQGSAIHVALSKGYVVASPGARGRTLKNSEGVYTGKAPAGLVDLKAAVCYLRYNDKRIAGDSEKIISNGTSAGGAMSSLLGATGDHPDYKPYLLELGAPDVPDHIYAVSAYCPITNLDHADCAYEWQFNGVNTYNNPMLNFIYGEGEKKDASGALTQRQIQVSDQLKPQFPVYLNSLGMKNERGELLTLDAQGNGNFKTLVISYVLASAQAAMDGGKDLSGIKWLTIKDKKVVDIDFEQYIRNMQRMKTPPAFDTFDLSAPENHLFGTDAINAQHFTLYSYDNSSVKGTLAASSIIKMMNPMDYIGNPESKTSGFWHIRYGSIDSNTSLAIEVILATYLQNKGYDVDFAIAWDRPHMGDYDLDELFAWMDNCCKKGFSKK
ncbi:MAG: subtype B tannase [Bacteroidales bacterium]